MKKSSAPGIPFRGYVCVDSLRPDDSLTILSMASSIGSRDSVSFLPTIQATGLLTFTLVGLSPTELRQPSLDTPTCRFIPAHPDRSRLPIITHQSQVIFLYDASSTDMHLCQLRNRVAPSRLSIRGTAERAHRPGGLERRLAESILHLRSAPPIPCRDGA